MRFADLVGTSFVGGAFGFVAGFTVGSHFSTAGLTDAAATLVGAFGGATVTVIGAFVASARAARQERSLREEQRTRRLNAARAVLASDLSIIVDFADAGAEVIATGLRQMEQERSRIEAPTLPQDILLRLQYLVELMDGQDAVPVVDLMHCIQVSKSRLQDVVDKANRPERNGVTHCLTRNNFTFPLITLAELHLRASAMFDYARPGDASVGRPPFSGEQIHSTAFQLGLEHVLTREEHDWLAKILSDIPAEGRWRR